MVRQISSNLHPSQRTKARLSNPSEAKLVDDEKIYQLRLKGNNDRQIANELEISVEQVRHTLKVRLNLELDHESPEKRMSILQLERERLDHVLAAHWDMMEAGDRVSTEAVLKTIALRIKLEKLDQLDPETQQSTVLVIAGSERDYIQGLRRLAVHDHSQEDQS